jgi:hypothetical protein
MEFRVSSVIVKCGGVSMKDRGLLEQGTFEIASVSADESSRLLLQERDNGALARSGGNGARVADAFYHDMECSQSKPVQDSTGRA